MQNDIFESQEKMDQARSSFSSLLEHPGFILLKKIVDANIELLSQYIIEGVEDETKETIDRLRDKLKVYKEVIGTPQTMLERLSPNDDNELPDSDPFPTIESVKKEKREALDNQEK